MRRHNVRILEREEDKRLRGMESVRVKCMGRRLLSWPSSGVGVRVDYIRLEN